MKNVSPADASDRSSAVSAVGVVVARAAETNIEFKQAAKTNIKLSQKYFMENIHQHNTDEHFVLNI